MRTDRQTDRHTYIDRQTERQTDRHTYILYISAVKICSPYSGLAPIAADCGPVGTKICGANVQNESAGLLCSLPAPFYLGVQVSRQDLCPVVLSTPKTKSPSSRLMGHIPFREYSKIWYMAKTSWFIWSRRYRSLLWQPWHEAIHDIPRASHRFA